MATIKSFQMPESEYSEMSEESMGICIQCGEHAYGVEPDARRYRCDACGELAVYGIEELLMMGRIEFV